MTKEMFKMVDTEGNGFIDKDAFATFVQRQAVSDGTLASRVWANGGDATVLCAHHVRHECVHE